jgi:hypothetical protein
MFATPKRLKEINLVDKEWDALKKLTGSTYITISFMH